MSERLIYLASPFSHERPEMEESRFWSIAVIADRLMQAGHLVLSPITHSYPIAKAGAHTDKSYAPWRRLNQELIRRCDEVWVVRMNGWMLSAGIQAEVEFAESIGKPVRCVEP